jgi:threonine dehydrogenase-like Zn-dependent dehydrogenase
MKTMQAITVEPGVADSLRLETFKVPSEDRGSVLIQAVALGICGTDRDIISARYGTAPPGHQRLIIGHESLGRVEDAPPDSGLAPGDLVIGVVRHPDPVPCVNCASGEWDMCRNGRYTEHGIQARDGFGSEYYRLDTGYLVKVDADLGTLAVLTEPTSIVAKAWEHIDHLGRRAVWSPKCVLITGAGPVGLLAAMFAVQRNLEVHVFDHNTRGPKPDLVRGLGATYHGGALDKLRRDFDIVIEATGVVSVIQQLFEHTSPNAITCLLGVSGPSEKTSIDLGAWNEEIVLGNRIVFGSVNANRRHYTSALTALTAADRDWLARIITRRVPLENWRAAYEKHSGDVKTVIEFPS